MKLILQKYQKCVGMREGGTGKENTSETSLSLTFPPPPPDPSLV